MLRRTHGESQRFAVTRAEELLWGLISETALVTGSSARQWAAPAGPTLGPPTLGQARGRCGRRVAGTAVCEPLLAWQRLHVCRGSPRPAAMKQIKALLTRNNEATQQQSQQRDLQREHSARTDARFVSEAQPHAEPVEEQPQQCAIDAALSPRICPLTQGRDAASRPCAVRDRARRAEITYTSVHAG